MTAVPDRNAAIRQRRQAVPEAAGATELLSPFYDGLKLRVAVDRTDQTRLQGATDEVAALIAAALDVSA